MYEWLLELHSEEIPARMQPKARDDLMRLATEGLAAAGLAHGPARAYSTPRRLTLVVEAVAAATRAVSDELKGPRVDAPAAALEGFLRKTGVAREALQRRDDKKGAIWVAVIETPARPAAEVIAALVPSLVRGFPWPKSMRWGAGELRWVRPLRSILCLLSSERERIAPAFAVDGVPVGDVTFGHRVLGPSAGGRPAPIVVGGYADYVAKLEAAGVTLDHGRRKAAIEAGAAAAAAAHGLELAPDPRLLEEVTGLVEHPVALSGVIDAAFLDLPAPVLQTSMREHQKFFAAREPGSGRILRFVTIANVPAADGGARIVAGNERVLRARLSDARFFFDNDRAKPLERNLDKLAAVTFHNRLGSQADRVARIRSLAADVARRIGADLAAVDRAATLAKADLASEMVYEFPELQGFMGRVYAEAAGERPEVAEAIEQHYRPIGAADAAPTAPIAVAVALADKLDALLGFWTIGEKPTGSGDPFGLRRAALGAIRIVLENRLRLSLNDLLVLHAPRIEAAALPEADGGPAPRCDGPLRAELAAFLLERLRGALRDKGARRDVVEAATHRPRGAGAPPDDFALIALRVEALGGLVGGPEGANLMAANKRASNILAAEEAKDGVEYSLPPDPRFAEGPEERALFSALDAAEAAIERALAIEDEAAAMGALAGLRAPLDAFFERVIVNAPKAITRRNRLCLMNRVMVAMGKIADFARLDG